MATQQSTFSQDLPPRPEPSWSRRACPGATFCWPFDWSSWTLGTQGDHAILLRRVCMWITLTVRTLTSILGLVYRLYGSSIGSFVVGLILAILGLFFIAYCLAGIGNMQGARRILGVNVNRWHFDIFLLGSAAIHIALIFFIFFLYSRAAFVVTWYGMWLLIFAAWWITTWATVDQSYV